MGDDVPLIIPSINVGLIVGLDVPYKSVGLDVPFKLEGELVDILVGINVPFKSVGLNVPFKLEVALVVDGRAAGLAVRVTTLVVQLGVRPARPCGVRPPVVVVRAQALQP